MTISMEPVAIVTVLLLLQYFVFGTLVARARGRHGVSAPATGGDDAFERMFRVQQNTLEQLIAVLPGLWLFGWYLSVAGAALLGLVFFIGRVLYLRAYVNDPRSRGLGFGLGAVATLLLLFGGLVGAVSALF